MFFSPNVEIFKKEKRSNKVVYAGLGECCAKHNTPVTSKHLLVECESDVLAASPCRFALT